MVKFAKKLERIAAAAASYSNHVIAYKPLKKRLEGLLRAGDGDGSVAARKRTMDQFLAVLREEVAKVDRYFEVEVQVWLQRLRAAWRAWRLATAGASSSTSTFTTASAAAADQVESELAFLGAQLEELDTFRRINYTGFRKILKKAEKKFAASFPATEEGGECETPAAALRDFEKEEVETATFLATDLDWLVAAMSYVFATLRSAATGASAVSDDVIIAANELWQVEESDRVAFLVDCVRHFRIGDLLDRNDSAELLDRADSVVPSLEVAVSCGRKWLWEAELEFEGDDRLSVQWRSASSSFSAFLGRDGEEECFSDVTEFRVVASAIKSTVPGPEVHSRVDFLASETAMRLRKARSVRVLRTAPLELVTSSGSRQQRCVLHERGYLYSYEPGPGQGSRLNMSFSEEFRNLCNHDERQRFSDPEAAQADWVGRPCGVTVPASVVELRGAGGASAASTADRKKDSVLVFKPRHAVLLTAEGRAEASLSQVAASLVQQARERSKEAGAPEDHDEFSPKAAASASQPPSSSTAATQENQQQEPASSSSSQPLQAQPLSPSQKLPSSVFAHRDSRVGRNLYSERKLQQLVTRATSAAAAAPQEFWSASTKLQTQKTEEDLFVEFHDNVEIPKVLVDADSMKTLVPLEPKTYLANERNLVQWVELAVLIFGAACALLQQSANDATTGAAASSSSNPNDSSSSSTSLKVAVDRYTGMLLVAVAAVQFWLGLRLYVMRSECISNGLLYARYFHTRAGPVLAAGGILVALCAHVYVSLIM